MAQAQDQVTGADAGSEVRDYDRSPGAIKSKIEQTRAKMDRTVSALAEELRPRRMLEEFLDYFRGSDFKADARRMARRAGHTTLEKIKDHPIPSVLAGAGLAYLIFFERQKEVRKKYSGVLGQPEAASEEEASVEECACVPETAAESSQSGPGMVERAKDKIAGAVESVKDTAASAAEKVKSVAAGGSQQASSSTSGAVEKVKGTAGKAKDATTAAAAKIKDKAIGTAASVRDSTSGMVHKMGQVASTASAKAGELASRTRHKARDLGRNVRARTADVGHSVRDKAGDFSDRVRRGYSYSRDRAVEISDQHPLAVGAALAGLGLLAGLAMPRTRREDEMLGNRSDRLKGKAKATGKDLLHRGMHVAQVTAEQTIDEAKRQGLTPSAIIDKARQVASELKHEAREVVEREQLTPDQLAEKVKALAGHAKETAQQEFEQQRNLQESQI